MLNVIGRHKIYTVPEIEALIRRKAGFTFVDKLPAIELAKDNVVYYRKTNDMFEDSEGKEWPLAVPYIVGLDSKGNRCWYTGGAGVTNYEKLKNLPTINGEIFMRDMNEAKARESVSADGVSGGYDLSLHDDDIIDIVREIMQEA